jgi:TRAP-type C4-dicarboxylate transport system permease small subunit
MNRVRPLLSGVAAIALFAMMLLTFADVFSRKFLGNSITGAVELTELGMLMMIFCALPLASLASEHVVFDLFDRLLPARWVWAQQTLANLVTAAIFAGAALIVWQRALRTSEMGDTTATLVIRIAPFQQAVAVLLLLTALAHAVLAWRGLRNQPTLGTTSPEAAGGNTP